MDGRVVEHCHTTVGSLATDALVREILKLIGKVTKDFVNITMNENFCINKNIEFREYHNTEKSFSQMSSMFQFSKSL